MWEEHWPALELFLAMRTQWRVVAGMAGAQHQGIDYTALYGHPKYARLGFDEQDALLAQVQHIEAGALSAMAQQNTPAVQEAEDAKQVTDAIQQRVDFDYQQGMKSLINVRELMNVMELAGGYGDECFVA
ncbi:DUF1799 domain-containing protein [Vreelandella nanhaiensis]|uniref:DUF1799 domain-containing protein n=1 Tax=Vreelandella nanhaiensis TaxID=1258546 RepID=UPI00163C3949|nr:DUF1799 domain-containing protein [Halomonas nanhaiensis]